MKMKEDCTVGKKIRCTFWNEFRHEKEMEEVRAHYPDGIHAYLASVFKEEADFEVRTAVMDDPENGLTDEVLDGTDVLFWWGHAHHDLVSDETAKRVADRVLGGMGLVVLHSGHFSKPFQRLLGTTGQLRWREDGTSARVWTVNPAHPIAQGVGPYIDLEKEEMYAEPFLIPDPDELVFISWYKGGEVFRSGCVFRRGAGKLFYFQPGHETYPNYHNKQVQQVLKNAARYVAPVIRVEDVYGCPCVPALEYRADDGSFQPGF